MPSQSQFFGLVLNDGVHPLPANDSFPLLLREAEPDIQYVSYQLEQGEEKKTLHFQAVCYVGKRRTQLGLARRLQKLLPGIHVKLLQRSEWPTQLEYTRKSHTRVDGPWEAGTNPQIGSDNSDRKSKHKFPPRTNPTSLRSVTILCGPPGCGKTSLVYGMSQELGLEVYSVPDRARQSQARWIGNYTGQPIVLIDEFRYTDFSRGTWLQILDRYDTNITSSMGGKTCLWQPQTIFLITNDRTQVDKLLAEEAIYRRVTRVKYWHDAPQQVREHKVIIEHAPLFQEETDDESPSARPWPEDPTPEDSTDIT